MNTVFSVPITISQNEECAPRRWMEVGINSAASRRRARWSMTFLRVFCREERGSRKINTEGPAPLRAAPRIPSVPFSSCRATQQRAQRCAIGLVNAVFQSRGEHVGASLGECRKQEHGVLDIRDQHRRANTAGAGHGGPVRSKAARRERRATAASSLSAGRRPPGLRRRPDIRATVSPPIQHADALSGWCSRRDASPMI